MTDLLTRPELELALSRLTDRTLSRLEVYGHVSLVLFAAGMAAIMLALLLTEPAIPPRLVVAFLAMLAIALAWVAFGLRVLSRKLPVLANREVVAARMALAFSTMFTVGAMLTGVTAGGGADTGAAWMGGSMVAIAAALLFRAGRRRAALEALRRRLESELRAP